jgi:hypothetical protein
VRPVKIPVRKIVVTLALMLLVVIGIRAGSGVHRPVFARLSIAVQPLGHPVMEGQSTTFQVVGHGIWPVTYQWWKNEAVIPGATSDRYTIPVATLGDNGTQFHVVLSSWGKALESDPATLRVFSPQPSEMPLFPIKASSNGKYLVDQNNKPFRIQGEAAWSLIANLTYAEADAYLSNRRAKGFNSVLVELMEHKVARGGKGASLSGVPTNRNGDLPFTGREGGGAYDGTWGTADFSTPNESYFAFADSIIDLAAKKGMLVNLAPMFLGYSGRNVGWWADLTNRVNSETVAYNFGAYVGRRYRNNRNIIWIIGGDYFPPTGSEGEARLLKFLEGIKSGGATQMWSGDWDAPCLSTDEPVFAPLMDMNAIYSYGPAGRAGATYPEARRGFAYSPTRPAYLKETEYEDEGWSLADPSVVRMAAYDAILEGATAGGFFGNRDVWKFGTDQWWWDPDENGHGSWVTAMESPGSFDFTFLGRLLDSVSWYDLIPSGLSGFKQLVTAGQGNYGTRDYVTAAATSDGSILLAYVPSSRKGATTITVDMTALRGSVQASWFDPTAGTYTGIGEGTFPNVATRAFTSPGMNSRRDFDWVLVLRAKSAQP